MIYARFSKDTDKLVDLREMTPIQVENKQKQTNYWYAPFQTKLPELNSQKPIKMTELKEKYNFTYLSGFAYAIIHPEYSANQFNKKLLQATSFTHAQNILNQGNIPNSFVFNYLIFTQLLKVDFQKFLDQGFEWIYANETYIIKASMSVIDIFDNNIFNTSTKNKLFLSITCKDIYNNLKAFNVGLKEYKSIAMQLRAYVWNAHNLYAKSLCEVQKATNIDDIIAISPPDYNKVNENLTHQFKDDFWTQKWNALWQSLKISIYGVA